VLLLRVTVVTRGLIDTRHPSAGDDRPIEQQQQQEEEEEGAFREAVADSERDAMQERDGTARE
jgi:hypothetical protein